MKKTSILAIAVALVMILAQCKKTETPTNDNEDRKVHITLDVSSNSRVIISPETGGTAFEQGDKVLVANNGYYVGTLTYDQSLRKFDGDLDEGLSEADYLHFYLLGNKPTTEVLTDPSNRPTTLTVNISDQTASYPEIAYAHSTMKYTNGVTAYTARLLNKCALVKFTTDNIPTSVAVTITGMNNQVSVNLSSNSFTYSKVGEGNISLHAESATARWGILLPQDAVTGATASAYGYAMTESFNVQIINENDYLDAGIAVNLAPACPVGAINGEFTINAGGGKVYFSKGNLQYIGSAATPYWKFADNQWDYLGNNGQGSTSETADRDLFGWGTSGYNHGATCYQPWSTDADNAKYYAYGNASNNLNSHTPANADWGYNAISNGGNAENSSWRTLTQSEWNYVFNIRTTTSGIRYAKAIVNEVTGIILLPDNWSTATYTLNNTNSSGEAFTSNSINATDWTNVLEASGAVFLPAAGYRSGTSLSYVGSRGNYWMDNYVDANNVRYLYFDSGNVLTTSYYLRYEGRSVRLVRNVPNP